MDYFHLPLPDVGSGRVEQAQQPETDRFLVGPGLDKGLLLGRDFGLDGRQFGPGQPPDRDQLLGLVALLAGEFKRLLDDFDLAPGQGIVPAGALHLRHQSLGKPPQFELRHARIQAGLAQPDQIDVRS